MNDATKVKISYTDKNNPPPVGPCGRIRWSKSRKRWTYRLNSKGSRAVAKWLAKHRTPLRLARGTQVLRPTYYALLNLGADKCDIEGELLVALAAGIARWDDQRGSMSTSIVWQMRNRLNQMIRHQKYRVKEINVVDNGCSERVEMDDRGFDQFPDPKSVEPEFREQALPESVQNAIAGIECPRARRVFLMRYQDGNTLRDIAAKVGHTKEFMRQVASGAMYFVQANLGVPITVTLPKLHSTTKDLRFYDPKHDPEVAARVLAGESYREVGNALGYKIGAVRRAVERMRKSGAMPPSPPRQPCPTT